MGYTTHTINIPSFVHMDKPFIILPVVSAAAVTAGTVVGKVTATGKFKAYDDDASDGTETAKGIAVSSTSGADEILHILVFGVVNEGDLTGLDNAAKADLAGKIFFVDSNDRWSE